MQVWINGEQRELDASATLFDALRAMGAPSSGIAVAVDGEVVPRDGWPTRQLTDGSRVEVLTAVQGG
jgi:sulfur carrier protein